jgi:hypothetical protein
MDTAKWIITKEERNNNKGALMIKKKFILKITPTSLLLLPVKKNQQFITVSNIKIETVDSFLNRSGSIIPLVTKNKRKNKPKL